MSKIQQKNKEIEQQIREISRNLLKNGEVDVILGYAKGSVPLATTPIFIKNEKDVDKLVWNNFCYINLASYLSTPFKNLINESNKDIKIGIISKGCTARALIHLSIENQVELENLKIIGIDCNGIINRRKIEKEFYDREISEVRIKDDTIIIKGKDFEEILPFDKYLNTLCKKCKVKAPPQSPELSEIIVGESQQISTIEDDFEDVIDFESKSPDERWSEIKELLKDCTRCYACREACPLCYCNLCFIDQNMPSWFDKTYDLSDIIVFHMIRALHLAGRCVACGACSSVCPMGIDLNLITRKLEKIVKDRFDFVSGLDPNTIPPMMDFKMEDKEEFMLEEN
ncbi:MAG: 4Fe-4S dicluster domain-containing protein [Candidatus Lokiarchaeota archaeon]